MLLNACVTVIPSTAIDLNAVFNPLETEFKPSSVKEYAADCWFMLLKKSEAP